MKRTYILSVHTEKPTNITTQTARNSVIYYSKFSDELQSIVKESKTKKIASVHGKMPLFDFVSNLKDSKGNEAKKFDNVLCDVAVAKAAAEGLILKVDAFEESVTDYVVNTLRIAEYKNGRVVPKQSAIKVNNEWVHLNTYPAFGRFFTLRYWANARM